MNALDTQSARRRGQNARQEHKRTAGIRRSAEKLHKRFLSLEIRDVLRVDGECRSNRSAELNEREDGLRYDVVVMRLWAQ